MNQYQAVLKALASLQRYGRGSQDLMLREEASSTDAKLGIIRLCLDSLDQFDSRPNAAGILPATARAAQPFAENGARRNEPAIPFVEWTGQRARLIGGAHADRNQRGEQVGGNRQTRTFRNVSNATNQLNPASLSDQALQHVADGSNDAFHGRGHNTGGDDRRFQ